MDLDQSLVAALADRYAIESEIDTGGMATVYRARDLRHERTVAIKVLRPDLAEAIGADRFLREIRTTANLSHPHILPLFDSGEAAGLLYYVMPFVEGESLRDRLDREGQLPVEDAVQIAREVAEALDYAHEKGVIHRDIKPANIMLERGHALLADFGIAQAKAGAGETRLTGMGMSLGTPAYMSPEQISGEGAVDGRSDQYALGCVLYEMLAGHPPFTGSDIQTVMRQHLAADAPKVTGARAMVPSGVAKAIHRSLAKTPADRFRTVAEFEKALAGATLPFMARIPMGRARGVGYAVGALVVAAVVWGLATRIGGPGAADDADGGWQPDPNVIAVAPFQNLTGDPTFVEYAERLALEVERRVSRADIGEVRNAARVLPLMWAAGEGADPIALLSQDLGAGTIVTGIVHRRGDSLDVQAYCTSAVTGESLGHLEPVRSAVGEEDALVTEIGDRVAGLLALRLDPENPFQSSSQPPLNPEAYAEYRRAIELGANREDWSQAADHFLRAWALDSAYLDGGLRAFTYLHQVSQLYGSSDIGGANRWTEVDSVLAILEGSVERMTPRQRRSFQSARDFFLANDFEAALRAARLRAREDSIEFAYGQGHSALFLNRTTEAVQAFRRWKRVDGEFLEGYVLHWPYYFHQYGDALHRLRRHEEELGIVLEGRRRSPGHYDLIYAELKARIALGQVQEARPLITEVGRRGPALDRIHVIWECFAHGLNELGRELLEEEVRRFDTDDYYADPRRKADVLHMLGRYDEAVAIYREVAEAHPDSPWQGLYQMGIVAAAMGDTVLAMEIDQRIALWPREAGNPASFPLVRAQIHARLGHREEAVRFLESAYFEHGLGFQEYHHAIFDLLPLRGYPPFDELMKGVG